MSDRVAKSYYSSEEKVGQSIHPYHSAWMAHWAGTGCDGSTQKHNYSFGPRGDNRDAHDIKSHQFLSGVENARSAKGFRGVKHGSAETSSRKMTDASLASQESQRSFNLQNDREISSMPAIRPQASRGKLPLALNIHPVSAPVVETLNEACKVQPESQLPMEQVKYHMFFGESSYSCSRQRSTLDHDQFKFDNGKTVSSFIHRQEGIKQVTSILSSKHVVETNLTFMGQNHYQQGHSPLLACEGKTFNFPACEKSASSYPRPMNMTALAIGPSTNTYSSPAYDDGQYHGIPNPYGSKMYPSSSRPSEMNKPRNLQYGHSVHDVLDSAEGLAGGQSTFSRTTHSLLITKHSDFGLRNENQILGESRGTTQLNRHTFSEIQRNFPLFNHAKQGVKLKLLGSSTDSEEKEEAGLVKTSEFVQKSESSAETDIMYMESFKDKDHLSGVLPSPSNKDMTRNPNLARQIAASTTSRSRKRTAELPDINLEVPSTPASPDSIEKPEQPSTSKTQSLDMELLLGNADKPGNSKSTESPLDSELSSSRWVKRLKLATPNSASDRIKNSNLEEPFSHEDRYKFFNKTMKGTSTSEPIMGHGSGKELVALDKSTKLSTTSESSSVDTGMKNQEIRLSHPWIQRWRHNQVKKKPETLFVTCDPQSTKLGTEILEKKQFPSIAAMALMGKVMNGFEPCQLQKKGSFIVWNTKNS